jgi:hypothetical protein
MGRPTGRRDRPSPRILIAAGALDGVVSGTFANDPVSFADGLIYEWTVIYSQRNVTLRLDNIVPTPGSIALLGLGGLIAARRRRA